SQTGHALPARRTRQSPRSGGAGRIPLGWKFNRPLLDQSWFVLPRPRTRPSSNVVAAAARLSSYSSGRRGQRRSVSSPRKSGIDVWCLKNKRDSIPSAAAAVEPSPAFQSRAELMRSLRDQEDVCYIYFSK